MRKSPWTLVLFMMLGGLLGGILGEVLKIIAPQGKIQKIFATVLPLGIEDPLTIDLVLFQLTLGFLIKMNLLAFLGIFIGIYLYKQF